MIDAGELRPGDVLQQRDIAKRIDVSPTPVREAFRRLEMAGVLTNHSRDGMRIAELDSSRSEATRRVRMALEHVAVDLLIEQITLDDVERLRLLNEQYRNGTADEAASAHWHFHLRLFEIAQTPILTNHLRVAWSMLAAQVPVRRPRGESADSHAEILAAIAAGDRDGAKQLLDEHFGHRAALDG